MPDCPTCGAAHTDAEFQTLSPTTREELTALTAERDAAREGAARLRAVLEKLQSHIAIINYLPNPAGAVFPVPNAEIFTTGAADIILDALSGSAAALDAVKLDAEFRGWRTLWRPISALLDRLGVPKSTVDDGAEEHAIIVQRIEMAVAQARREGAAEVWQTLATRIKTSPACDGKTDVITIEESEGHAAALREGRDV